MHVFQLGNRINPDEINENFAELAANSTRQFAQNKPQTQGLQFAYFGGVTRAGAAPVTVPGGSVDLVANATNRVELDPANGAVTTQTTANWNPAKIPLYLIQTGEFQIIETIDVRASLVAPGSGNGGGNAGGGVAAAGAVERVTVTAPAREPGAGAGVLFALGTGASIGRVQTSAPAWLRIYPTFDDRDADSSRGINDDPRADVTLGFECATEAGRLSLNVAPAAALFDPENDGWPARIVNLSGAPAAVEVTLTVALF